MIEIKNDYSSYITGNNNEYMEIPSDLIDKYIVVKRRWKGTWEGDVESQAFEYFVQ